MREKRHGGTVRDANSPKRHCFHRRRHRKRLRATPLARLATAAAAAAAAAAADANFEYKNGAGRGPDGHEVSNQIRGILRPARV